ncbi:MAG: DUF4097 family beta strand repeat-containing protein [Firmicutes bacterium]|nr:DUF4097 family beta strand repeat-containing protein [Bacillota bacterium]MCL5038638.1 DUF4097 family beta strand repeat-containing protein [Bacillota bacterium]
MPKRELAGKLLFPLVLVITGTLLLLDRLAGTHLTGYLWEFWPLIPLVLGVEILLRIYLARRQGDTVLVRPARSAVVLTVLVLLLGLASLAITGWVTDLGQTYGLNIKDPVSFLNLLSQLTFDLESNIGNVVHREEFHRQEPAGGLGSLSLANVAGDIRVLGTGDQEIKIDAVIEGRGFDEEEARKNATAIKIEVTRSGNTLQIKAVDPEATDLALFDLLSKPDPSFPKLTPKGQLSLVKRSSSLSRARVNYQITLPAHLALNVAAVAGKVTVTGLNNSVNLATVSAPAEAERINGPVNLATVSGEAALREIQGSLNVKTISGTVRLSDVHGPVTASTTSGPIHLQTVQGNQIDASSISGDIKATSVRGTLALHTTSGSMEVADAAGPVTITTISGDVSARLPRDAEGFLANSTSGALKLTLEPGVSAHLSARTRSGSLRIKGELPFSTSRSGNTATAEGVLGDGRARINLLTTSGDITIISDGG